MAEGIMQESLGEIKRAIGCLSEEIEQIQVSRQQFVAGMEQAKAEHEHLLQSREEAVFTSFARLQEQVRAEEARTRQGIRESSSELERLRKECATVAESLQNLVRSETDTLKHHFASHLSESLQKIETVCQDAKEEHLRASEEQIQGLTATLEQAKAAHEHLLQSREEVLFTTFAKLQEQIRAEEVRNQTAFSESSREWERLQQESGTVAQSLATLLHSEGETIERQIQSLLSESVQKIEALNEVAQNENATLVESLSATIREVGAAFDRAHTARVQSVKAELTEYTEALERAKVEQETVLQTRESAVSTAFTKLQEQIRSEEERLRKEVSDSSHEIEKMRTEFESLARHLNEIPLVTGEEIKQQILSQMTSFLGQQETLAQEARANYTRTTEMLSANIRVASNTVEQAKNERLQALEARFTEHTETLAHAQQNHAETLKQSEAEHEHLLKTREEAVFASFEQLNELVQAEEKRTRTDLTAFTKLQKATEERVQNIEREMISFRAALGELRELATRKRGLFG